MLKNLIIIFIIFSVSANGQSLLKVRYEAFAEVDVDNITVNGVSLKNTNLADAVINAKNDPYYYELLLDKNKSTFKLIDKINNEQTSENIIIVLNPGGGHFFKNLEENFYIEEVSYMNKNFRIKDSLPNYNWKIEKDQKQILNYDVRKATSLDSTRIITAWYCPKLVFKDGPKNIWSLPGLILEVEILNKKTNDKYIFRAKSIDTISEKDKNYKFTHPQKGEFIKKNELQVLIKEQEKKEREFYNQGVDTE